jgi:hypothetical protein
LKKSQNQGEGNSGGIRNGAAGMVKDVVLLSIEANREFDYEIWIGDNGASCHDCNSNVGLTTTLLQKKIGDNMGNSRCGILENNGK